MKKISQEQIESICNYLLGSALPSKDVQQIVSIMKTLPTIEAPQGVNSTP